MRLSNVSDDDAALSGLRTRMRMSICGREGRLRPAGRSRVA